jgi:hypothetical protein
MKLKSILKYEKTTNKSFFDLSKKFSEDESYSMTDVMEMVWISKLDENPDLALVDAIESEAEIEDVLKEFGDVLLKKQGNDG